MHNISEHNTEQEWEGDYSKYRGIDFLVLRNTIGIHDFLEWPSKLISFNKCWPDVLLSIELMYQLDMWSFNMTLASNIINCLLKLWSKL